MNQNKSPQKEKPCKDPVRVLFEIFNFDENLNYPVTMTFMKREAYELRQWAKTEDALRLEDFYDFRGYSKRAFYNMLEACPQMQEAHEFAKRRIGARREEGALTRRFEAATVHKTLGHYWNVWKEEEEYRAKIRADIQNAQENQQTVVIIDKLRPDGEVIDTTLKEKATPEEVATKIRRKTKQKVETYE